VCSREHLERAKIKERDGIEDRQVDDGIVAAE
jgi:hypothetical protein